ncbi:hypothetical protein G7046_g9677 [Stylonectria norvegica]|nr:hypothetical protein G7046_g9677 [Stylonectria norvegica]
MSNLSCASPGKCPSSLLFSEVDALLIPTNTTFPPGLNLQYSIRNLSPSRYGDRTLVDDYMYHLSSFLSIKASNFDSYSIHFMERYVDSPLRHGILAWTSVHLIVTDQSLSGDAVYRHYARGRSLDSDPLAELAVEADFLGLSPLPSKKPVMLLSTCLLLGFCIVLSGNIEALAWSKRN